MASTSRQPRDDGDVPPIQKFSSKKTKKGKGKERVKDLRQEHDHPPTTEYAAEREEILKTEWPWLCLTDSSASHVPPVFTKDGNYFFSMVGPSVKIYSSATGEVVSTLSGIHPYRSHPQDAPKDWQHPLSDTITSAILNPRNPFQLITGSLNGCIMLWDFLDASLLQVIDLEQPILRLCAHDKIENTLFVGATRVRSKISAPVEGQEDWGAVLRVALKPTDATASQRIQKSSQVTVLGQTRFLTGLIISASGKWVVATAGHKAYVTKAMVPLSPGGKTPRFVKYVSPEKITCLARHPTEDFFVTGDDRGVVRLWYCLDERIVVKAVGVEKRAQTTTLHWHAHAVSSLAFTPNGAYLLTGGEEAVLVIWQLHTGKKEFVPRVGAPITTIAVSRRAQGEEEYLLGLADATYVIISSGSLKITRSFSRIKLDPMGAIPPGASIPLAVHSLSSTVILPSSHPSSLQIYSPPLSRLVAELEISPSNRVSRQDEKPIEHSRVEVAVIGPDGEWMATIDSRKGDENFRGEIYLKVWRWDKKSGFWILNTRIDRPHGLEPVNFVVFDPALRDGASSQFVTVGQDGFIKAWRRQETKTKSGDVEEFWVARSNFKFRSQIPNHASWSTDGSLLAVALGTHVALYDPMTTALLRLFQSRTIPSVVSARFLGTTGRYVVIAGEQDLALWDLVTFAEHRLHSSGQRIQTVLCHPSEESFAVVYQSQSAPPELPSTSISLFRPSSDRPYAIHTVPFALVDVTWYRGPRSTAEVSAYTLVGITSTWSVVLFGDHIEAAEDDGSSAREIVNDSQLPQRRTLFQDIFGMSAFPSVSTAAAAPSSVELSIGVARSRGVGSILDGPAHLMPPLETLYESIMEALRRRTEDETSQGQAGAAVEGEDVDVEMADEEPPILVTNVPQRIVDKQQMDMLVELFRTGAVTHGPAAPQTPTISLRANGVGTETDTGLAKPSLSSSLSKAQVNGVMSTPSTCETGGPALVAHPSQKKKKRTSI